jgi:hypothetical protein
MKRLWADIHAATDTSIKTALRIRFLLVVYRKTIFPTVGIDFIVRNLAESETTSKVESVIMIFFIESSGTDDSAATGPRSVREINERALNLYWQTQGSGPLLLSQTTSRHPAIARKKSLFTDLAAMFTSCKKDQFTSC